MRRYVFLGFAFATLGACASVPPATVYNIGAMTPERISPGMTRRYVMADQSTMAIYDLRKGARVPVHQHTSEQLSYVQSGRLRFVVGGQIFDLRAGQLIVIAPNAPHSIEALETSVEYDYFTPPRSSWEEDRDEGSAPDLAGPPGSRRP